MVVRASLGPGDPIRCERFGCTIRARTCAARQAINERHEGRRAMRRRGRAPIFPGCTPEQCGAGREVLAALPVNFVPLHRLERGDWASTAAAQSRYLADHAARLAALE